ncbi:MULTISPECIES: DUF4141 domain-containing protein [Stenotrophomonas]|uniref:DUF4141 domain-containing protein n=1 Tax=Stenotrophomonas TaxID=40323 RepID=UPI001F083384|nr:MULTISPECIES: DUF4141 domain-containing protein [Stenotrophomonas]
MTRTSPVRSRAMRLLACVAVAMLLLAGPAHATWTVNDPQSMAKAIEQYKRQAEHYKQQVEHYKQQLIQLNPLPRTDSVMTDSFSERSEDYQLQERCPGAAGRGIGGLTSRLGDLLPGIGGDAASEQTRICARIVRARNTQYNATVRMLDRLVQRNQQFEAIQTQRSQTGNSQGKLAANDNEVHRFAAQNEMDLQHWQAQMKAYDGYIEGLTAQRAQLARQALDGKPPSLLGQLVRGAVLARALSN